MRLNEWSFENQQRRQAETLLSSFPPNIFERLREYSESLERQQTGGLFGEVIEQIGRIDAERKNAETVAGSPLSAIAEGQKIGEQMREYQQSVTSKSIPARAELEQIEREMLRRANEADFLAERRERFEEMSGQFAEQLAEFKESAERPAVTIIINLRGRQTEKAQDES